MLNPLYCIEINWQGLPGTDWIQAIGAFIAIIAGIYGFIKLFQRDTDRQHQIDSLITLAKESQAQTEHLRKSNELLSDQVKVLHDANKIWDKRTAVAQEHLDLDKKKHRLAIQPIFACEEANGNDNDFLITLVNWGEAGIYQGLETSEVQQAKIITITNPPVTIVKNDTVKIRITVRSLGEIVNFVLLTADAEGSKYSQYVHGTPLKLQFDSPMLRS